MKCLILACIVLMSCGVLSADEDVGYLEASCNKAQDCYINGGRELALACYYNVNKCVCQQTVRSIYNLVWNKASKQCLSSRYGHCGVNGAVKVGCSDGYACIDKRCRDPNDNTKTVKDAFQFDVSSCEACRFSDDLTLPCEGWDSPRKSCRCILEYPADKRSNLWDLRNYDRNHNCSVSQFGPCGTRNGVKIECHGAGMECVNGVCTNPTHPLSSLREPCQDTKNCDRGLICSHGYVCIQPKSSVWGVNCYNDEECAEGLACKHNPLKGPWSSNGCYDINETFAPRRPSPTIKS